LDDRTAVGEGTRRLVAAKSSYLIAKHKIEISKSVFGLTGRLRALFAGRRATRGGGEVVWAMGLLWKEGGGDYG
jgi:hypothetical protein